MSAGDYRAAAGNGTPLSGSPVAAIWNVSLEVAKVAAGRGMHEQIALGSLLGDLAKARRD